MASNKISERVDEMVVVADTELVSRSVNGDRKAFGLLVQRYQDRVYNLSYRLVGQHHGALDLSQEAFLKALAAMPGFRGESGFYTWLYRIVLNLHMNKERSLAAKAARKTIPLNPGRREELEGNERRSVTLEDPRGGDPSLPMQNEERDDRIQAALLELEAQHRQVVLLCDMEGLAYEEIADLLEVPLGTVKSRLHRAREALKVKLKGLR